MQDVRLRVLIQSSEASKGLEVMRTQLEAGFDNWLAPAWYVLKIPCQALLQEAQRTNARLRVQQAHYMSMVGFRWMQKGLRGREKD